MAGDPATRHAFEPIRADLSAGLTPLPNILQSALLRSRASPSSTTLFGAWTSWTAAEICKLRIVPSGYRVQVEDP
jgi:hypothetical protein